MRITAKYCADIQVRWTTGHLRPGTSADGTGTRSREQDID